MYYNSASKLVCHCAEYRSSNHETSEHYLNIQIERNLLT